MIGELGHAAQSMVQGSLSELTRRCGDASCACASDPAARHGPHLYFKYTAAGTTHSVYVPAEHGTVIKDAQGAWRHFQELGTVIAADNRERFLQGLRRDKQRVKARRAKARQARVRRRT